MTFESSDSPSTVHRPTGASASRRAYDYVKDRLLDGRFPGGTLLSENEIAQRLGLSRTPVRQAFVELQGEGLLDLYPRRGGLVIPVSPTEADDVLEARLLLEPYCSRRAAGLAGAALDAELQAAIAEQEAALGQPGTEFIKADRRFHRAIVAAPATCCWSGSTTPCATAISASPPPRWPATRPGSSASSPSTARSPRRSSAATPPRPQTSPRATSTPRTSSPAKPAGNSARGWMNPAPGAESPE